MDRSSDSGLDAVAASLAAIPEVVVVVDAFDRVAALNAPALALFPALSIGVQLARYVRSPDILDAISKARATGAPVRTSWSMRAPVERVFEVSATAVAGLACGDLVIVYCREISEARRFERMRVDFVANASHELRTPLASLLGFIETMQGPARDDERARARFLDIMRDQALRMARLVDDLLSLSRIEQHLHLQPRDYIDIASVLHHIGDTLTPLAQSGGIELDIRADEPIAVSGDRDELLRVVENLVENAIKYGAAEADDKRVMVSLARVDGEAVITVRDFGNGIAPEHLPRLTERFYRVDAGQSRARGGTGLGLAIVKHVVARHRGRLKIDSVRGRGSTFHVYLPLHPTDADQHPLTS